LEGANDLPQYRVFDFAGKLCCSDGKGRLQGELHSRQRGELVIPGSQEKVILHPGDNHIAIKWNL
jgi:hypothetical protein